MEVSFGLGEGKYKPLVPLKRKDWNWRYTA
jgi:hypothetical protein